MNADMNGNGTWGCLADSPFVLTRFCAQYIMEDILTVAGNLR